MCRNVCACILLVDLRCWGSPIPHTHAHTTTTTQKKTKNNICVHSHSPYNIHTHTLTSDLHSAARPCKQKGWSGTPIAGEGRRELPASHRPPWREAGTLTHHRAALPWGRKTNWHCVARWAFTAHKFWQKFVNFLRAFLTYSLKLLNIITQPLFVFCKQHYVSNSIVCVM